MTDQKIDPETGEVTEKSRLYGPRPGSERLDPKPVAIPAGFKRPETLAEQVQRLVRTQISREAREAGFETFEESEDFDVDDDAYEPSTPYETFFDPVLGRDLSADEFRRNEKVYKERYETVGSKITKAQLAKALNIDPEILSGSQPPSTQEGERSTAKSEASVDGSGT